MFIDLAMRIYSIFLYEAFNISVEYDATKNGKRTISGRRLGRKEEVELFFFADSRIIPLLEETA